MKTNTFIYGNVNFLGKSAAAKRMIYYAKAIADEENKVFLASCCYTKIRQENFNEIEPGIYVLESKEETHSLYGSLLFLNRLHSFSKRKTSTSRFILYPQSYFFLELFSVCYMILLKRNRVFYELNEVKKHFLFLYKLNPSSKIKAFYKPVIGKILFIIMDNLMRYYAGLICISTNIQAYGEQYNKNTIRIPILTNPRIQTKITDKIYSEASHFNIGFSGSIIPGKENLLEFIAVLNKVSDTGYNLKFNLCGTISEKDFKIIIDSSNKENTVKYYGNLDANELSNFLKQQDLLVIPRGYTLQNKYGFSTKLSDYLNHQKLILITDVSDNTLYIKDGINGFVVEPNDSRDMYEKLIYIIENYNILEKKIIENAILTSKKSFDFRLYKSALQSFLKLEN